MTKVYKGGPRVPDKVAVDNLSLDVMRGESVCLLGPNGSGKTTLIKMIAGLVTPTRGVIRIGAMAQASSHSPVRGPGSRGAPARLGIVSGDSRSLYWRLTCAQNLQYFGTLRSGRWWRALSRRIDDLLQALGLAGVLHLPAGDLSRGLQQRLALAVGLISDPEVLILDEPTSGLDVLAVTGLKELLRRLLADGRTLFIATHDMGFSEAISDKVAIMQEGRLIAFDTVLGLSRLLKTQSYEILVDGNLEGPEVQRLMSTPLVTIDTLPGGVRIAADVEDIRSLYHILDILRQSRASILSLAKKEPNLERVYKEIVGGAGIGSIPGSLCRRDKAGDRDAGAISALSAG
ncbi:MAG TPA: ABC transporter ATP-binding protein [Firmicutes bacterium]|nr:ABC transporter ATP-binding protein [Bacillota bacterium]